MQIIHDPAKLNSQTDKLSRLQTARSLNSGIQRLTAQIFLDEIIIIFVNFQIVDDRDSRMAQPLQKRCFLNETALCPQFCKTFVIRSFFCEKRLLTHVLDFGTLVFIILYNIITWQFEYEKKA